ncbi:Galectin-3-binding protein A [Echinococcus granulosus]|uniref:Galectin-3-binding protein A n=1 Tax=Echinococcus granulosus TaxID=6210 RepID=W6UF05_ECHGR|nr:Galectin-3-binding protein A [Echinococcus granulosus]EUB59975.1 Galectin-3-binding protein A [Echinococcus granulosus]
MVVNFRINRLLHDGIVSLLEPIQRFSPPYGVPILNSHRTSSYPTRISSFNCTGRVTLGPNPPEPLSVHLGYCEYATVVPSPCHDHKRDVAIACLEPMKLGNFNAPPPVTFAPVSCPNNSSEVRLTHGGEKSGRLEVKHLKSGIWGTVCADGFGTNEAKAVCRMLCSSSDDLAYAHAVINVFGGMSREEVLGAETGEEELPIHLARIACPVSAQSLNDCALGDGWGSTQGCTHALDVGVICGPEAPLTPLRMQSNLTCDGETARVQFRREQLGEVGPMTVHLNRSLPEGCFFNFTTPVDLDGFVEVAFPMDKCGGTYERSNSTTLAVHLSLVVNATRGLLQSGVRSGEGGGTEVFVLPLTCLVDRSDSVRSAVRAVATSRLQPLVATRPTPPVRLTFFADRLFQRRVSDNINILPHRRVFALISLAQPERNSKLILRNCWLSSNETTSETSIPVIANGCPVNPEIHLHPISRNAVGFSFETAYLRRKSQPLNGGSLLQLFVVCQTRLCQIYETDPKCIQNYCS